MNEIELYNFHKEELLRIKKHTSSSKKTKLLISKEIELVQNQLYSIESQLKKDKIISIKYLLDKYSSARSVAINSGSKSYSDPVWAVPAIIESWLQIKLIYQDNIEINDIINDLKDFNRVDETSKVADYLGLFFVFILTPLLLYNGIFYLSLFTLIVGLIFYGWKYRYN